MCDGNIVHLGVSTLTKVCVKTEFCVHFFLATIYIRALIDKVIKLNVGCNIAGTMVNLLVYADGTVLLAPSWRGLQLLLLKVVEAAAVDIKMSFNTKKTV